MIEELLAALDWEEHKALRYIVEQVLFGGATLTEQHISVSDTGGLSSSETRVFHLKATSSSTGTALVSQFAVASDKGEESISGPATPERVTRAEKSAAKDSTPQEEGTTSHATTSTQEVEEGVHSPSIPHSLARKLSLKRPLLFLDTETTGLNVKKDRIVQLGFVKLLQDGNAEAGEWKLNPGIPIPASASKVHGIFDKDVVGCATFGMVYEKLLELAEGCDLAGYNIESYDIPLLKAECARLNVDPPVGFPPNSDGNFQPMVIDVMQIFHKKEPRDLAHAYQLYCGREVDSNRAHSAWYDANVALEVLQGQLDRYTDLPTTVEELREYLTTPSEGFLDPLNKLQQGPGDSIIINFGKFSGTTLQELAEFSDGRKYLEWLASHYPDNASSKDVRGYAERALDGVFQIVAQDA